MNDNLVSMAHPLGVRIREIRKARGLSLAALAEQVGTSAPTLHRYESGWDRFELATLRRIAAALGAKLEIRIVPGEARSAQKSRSAGALVRLLAPLFWDKPLREADLTRHPAWVLARALTAGHKAQVRAARAWFGDEAILRSVERRGIDARTRTYWRMLLEGADRASQSPRA